MRLRSPRRAHPQGNSTPQLFQSRFIGDVVADINWKKSSVGVFEYAPNRETFSLHLARNDVPHGCRCVKDIAQVQCGQTRNVETVSVFPAVESVKFDARYLNEPLERGPSAPAYNPHMDLPVARNLAQRFFHLIVELYRIRVWTVMGQRAVEIQEQTDLLYRLHAPGNLIPAIEQVRHAPRGGGAGFFL